MFVCNSTLTVRMHECHMQIYFDHSVKFFIKTNQKVSWDLCDHRLIIKSDTLLQVALHCTANMLLIFWNCFSFILSVFRLLTSPPKSFHLASEMEAEFVIFWSFIKKLFKHIGQKVLIYLGDDNLSASVEKLGVGGWRHRSIKPVKVRSFISNVYFFWILRTNSRSCNLNNPPQFPPRALIYFLL